MHVRIVVHLHARATHTHTFEHVIPARAQSGARSLPAAARLVAADAKKHLRFSRVVDHRVSLRLIHDKWVSDGDLTSAGWLFKQNKFFGNVSHDVFISVHTHKVHAHATVHYCMARACNRTLLVVHARDRGTCTLQRRRVAFKCKWAYDIHAPTLEGS